MKTIIFAASAAMLTMIACAAPSTAADQLEVSDIVWKATPAEGQDQPQFRVSHKRSTSDVSLNSARPELGVVRSALQGPAGPVSFTIVHDTGTLACTGTLKARDEGDGTCRFTSDPVFEAALKTRGLAPDPRGGLLAMLMVDATIDLADGLTREGVKPGDSDDLIAAAALGVTPAYVHDLKSEALALTDIDDAIACKALEIDGAYVRALVTAGYRNLSADDVVGMKAMGVTGEYAQAMNRAARSAK